MKGINKTKQEIINGSFPRMNYFIKKTIKKPCDSTIFFCSPLFYRWGGFIHFMKQTIEPVMGACAEALQTHFWVCISAPVITPLNRTFGFLFPFCFPFQTFLEKGRGLNRENRLPALPSFWLGLFLKSRNQKTKDLNVLSWREDRQARLHVAKNLQQNASTQASLTCFISPFVTWPLIGCKTLTCNIFRFLSSPL